MTTPPPQAEFTEDRIPFDGIDETVGELVDLYGGEMKSSAHREHRFILPLRRGVAAAGGIECMLTWTADDESQATVRVVCDRHVDAPKAQRVALLVVGVIGSVLFMLWPFYPDHERGMGSLAWFGAAVAIAVYFLTLRRAGGGIALDFLQRLARRQRATDDR